MLNDCYIPEIKRKESSLNNQNNNNNENENEKNNINNISSYLNIELGLINNVSGSAYLEIGTSKVICSIHGPYSSQRKTFSNIGQLECNIRYSNSSLMTTNTTTTSKIESYMITNALEGSVRLEKYPKTTISIQVVVLETLGYELSAIITCASLALINASIEVNDLVCASSLTRIGSTYLPYPSSKVLSNGEILDTVTVASMPTTNSISQIWFDGSLEPDVINEMINGCCVFNKELRTELRKKLIEKSFKE